MIECIHCKKIDERGDFIGPFPSDRRGGKPGYICPECLHKRPHNSNNNIVRGANTRGRLYQFYFPAAKTTDKATFELTQNYYILAGRYYKSPIFQNLKSPAKNTHTLQRLINNNYLQIDNTDNCKIAIFTSPENAAKIAAYGDYIEKLTNIKIDGDKNSIIFYVLFENGEHFRKAVNLSDRYFSILETHFFSKGGGKSAIEKAARYMTRAKNKAEAE